MSFKEHFFLFLCVTTTGAHLSDDVANAFQNANICSDTYTEPPQDLLQVVYGDTAVLLGNKLNTLQVVNEPAVSYNCDPDSYYTLIMIDPDAVFPGFINLPGQALHWIVGNIKGCDVSSGETVVPYLSPMPPPLSESHRYTLILYQHNCKKTYDDLGDYVNTANRLIFYIDKFIKKHDLCNPMFGNYFNGYTADITF